MCREGDANAEDVIAAWLHGDSDSDVWKRAEQLEEDENLEQLQAFYRAYYGDDVIKGPLPRCDVCLEPLPDAVARWMCSSCNWDMCIDCAENNQWTSCCVMYDLPPAAGESKAAQEQRRQRHMQREMTCIRELDGGAAACHRARKATQDRERRVRSEQLELCRHSSAPLSSWHDFWDQLE
jgi:hypothetical protein